MTMIYHLNDQQTATLFGSDIIRAIEFNYRPGPHVNLVVVDGEVADMLELEFEQLGIVPVQTETETMQVID